MPLLCDRPHWRDVDFETSRFIVCKVCGVQIGDRLYEMGEELPRGVLEPDVLRQIYDTPLRLIELAEFAAWDPDLCEACAQKGVFLSQEVDQMEVVEEVTDEALQPEAEPTPPIIDPDIDINALDRTQLVELCEKLGLPTHGPNLQLRERISTKLA